MPNEGELELQILILLNLNDVSGYKISLKYDILQK